MIAPRAPAIAWIMPSETDAHRKAPPGIRIVMHTVTISRIPRVIIGTVPWIVIISCSVYHNTTIHIRAGVSGCIPNINHFRCIVINIYVFHIVDRAFCRDIFNIFRPFSAYSPWPHCAF